MAASHCKLSKILHTNFGELPFRNCLEIRNESRSGDCRAARRGRRVVYLPLLAPTTHPPEASQLFSKQFLHELRCIRVARRRGVRTGRVSCVAWTMKQA